MQVLLPAGIGVDDRCAIYEGGFKLFGDSVGVWMGHYQGFCLRMVLSFLLQVIICLGETVGGKLLLHFFWG